PTPAPTPAPDSKKGFNFAADTVQVVTPLIFKFAASLDISGTSFLINSFNVLNATIVAPGFDATVVGEATSVAGISKVKSYAGYNEVSPSNVTAATSWITNAGQDIHAAASRVVQRGVAEEGAVARDCVTGMRAEVQAYAESLGAAVTQIGVMRQRLVQSRNNLAANQVNLAATHTQVLTSFQELATLSTRVSAQTTEMASVFSESAATITCLAAQRIHT
ncbi:MAG: hypothetical protein LBK01_05380, partial [Burkholderiaceae bacterium]|nr:hypothetical protein [Burkholderiaceae bacterium]